jgi:structural maintenance of chromosome 2
VKELEETQRGIKKINPKVMNMIDKWVFFLQYMVFWWRILQGSKRRKPIWKKNIAIVEKDKVKIDETIESIDRQKRDALQTTKNTEPFFSFLGISERSLQSF